MKLANNNKVVLKHREIFRECFESMLKWFHNTYIEGDVTKLMPPTIGGYEICLFDLYKLVKCFGGYERLNYKMKLDEVSLGAVLGRIVWTQDCSCFHHSRGLVWGFIKSIPKYENRWLGLRGMMRFFSLAVSEFSSVSLPEDIGSFSGDVGKSACSLYVSSLGGCVPDVEAPIVAESLLQMDNVNVPVVSSSDHSMSQADVTVKSVRALVIEIDGFSVDDIDCIKVISLYGFDPGHRQDVGAIQGVEPDVCRRNNMMDQMMQSEHAQSGWSERMAVTRRVQMRRRGYREWNARRMTVLIRERADVRELNEEEDSRRNVHVKNDRVRKSFLCFLTLRREFESFSVEEALTKTS
ncbi:ARID DNA-binding domain-containing protein [Tanacetum coccineum]